MESTRIGDFERYGDPRPTIHNGIARRIARPEANSLRTIGMLK
jgi:hypothetical protein